MSGMSPDTMLTVNQLLAFGVSQSLRRLPHLWLWVRSPIIYRYSTGTPLPTAILNVPPDDYDLSESQDPISSANALQVSFVSQSSQLPVQHMRPNVNQHHIRSNIGY